MRSIIGRISDRLLERVAPRGNAEAASSWTETDCQRLSYCQSTNFWAAYRRTCYTGGGCTAWRFAYCGC